MNHILAIIIALAALCIPNAPAMGDTAPPDSRRPRLIGAVALGGGTEGIRLSGDRPTSLGVEVKLRLENALGPVSLTAACRHFLNDDEGSFWRGKSKLNAGFDVPVGPDALLFAEYERKYYGGESWSWAGLRWKFRSH